MYGRVYDQCMRRILCHRSCGVDQMLGDYMSPTLARSGSISFENVNASALTSANAYTQAHAHAHAYGYHPMA